MDRALNTHFQQQIRLDRVRLLYASTWLSILTQWVIAVIFVFTHFGNHPWEKLAGWFVAMSAILVARALLKRAYDASQPGIGSCNAWLWRFRTGVVVTGLAWGVAGLQFFMPEAVAYQGFNVIVLIGLTAGAMVVMVPDFPAFTGYAMSLLLPVTVRTLAQGDELHVTTGLLTILFLAFMLRSCRRFSDSLVTSLQLRYENQSLVETLGQEKKRLDNRLGRILNDGSTEIYIFDAESLVCLQVNAGAAQHVGYSRDELTGRRVFDFLLDGLDADSFGTLVKPLREGQAESVLHRGRNRRRDGTTYDVEARLQLSTEEDPPVFVATVLDITERVQHEQELVNRANFDQLTGLPNRNYMLACMDGAFARARRNGQLVGLMFIDLDNFKNINDTMGHRAGDELLKQAAERIRSIVRKVDTPSRLSGDEFLILLEGLKTPSDVEIIAHKLVSVFEAPFMIESKEIYATSSIGVSLFPNDGDSAEILLQHADTAMYQAKRKGRNDYRFFTLKMRTDAEERLAIESHLRQALNNDELSLVYQPKYDCATGDIVGAEALLRWNNPVLGQVPPDKFIKVAEDTGFIDAIGNWVLQNACAEASRWQLLSSSPVHVAVNVSSRQFRSGRLWDVVERALQMSGLPNHFLELEITESLLMQDAQDTVAILNYLHAHGISLALDDFGTGYSSLAYLKRFPLQVLKIDRSFVRDLTVDSNDAALVDAIIAMAHSLGMAVVAEGVETPEQHRYLQQRHVEVVQGFLFSKPVPAAEFRQLLVDRQPRPGERVAMQ